MAGIEFLPKEDENNYSDFLLAREDTLFFQSLKYRNFLKLFIGAEDKYIVAKENGKIIGALPAFIKINDKYGNVLNSLPFYGSNGGIIVDKNLGNEQKGEVKKELLKKFYEFEGECGCISSTIIASPFEEDPDFYENNLSFNQRDYRIGQITSLPGSYTADLYSGPLIEKFHKKTRNSVRKSYKESIEFRIEHGDAALEYLEKVHKENMEAIGGKAKESEFFDSIDRIFKKGEDYDIYIAYKDNKRVAALLLFKFNKTIEYFSPVIDKDYRSSQAMSLLIYESMKRGIDEGFKYYNFGGTWESQEGVYNFKKKWGADDLRYNYYIKLNKETDYFKSIGKEKSLSEYPYFYVLPFKILT